MKHMHLDLGENFGANLAGAQTFRNMANVEQWASLFYKRFGGWKRCSRRVRLQQRESQDTHGVRVLLHLIYMSQFRSVTDEFCLLREREKRRKSDINIDANYNMMGRYWYKINVHRMVVRCLCNKMWKSTFVNLIMIIRARLSFLHRG